MRGLLAVCLILTTGALTAGCTTGERQPPPSPQVTAPAQGGLAMAVPRASHTATPLPGGRVLIVGGCVVDHCDGTAGADSELFDPATGRFTPGAPLSVPRAGHTATALTDGRVLVVGGFPGERLPPLASAEVYDPATGRFEPTGVISARRAEHTATRLRDGRVLIAGGANGMNVLAGAEIYDPATGRFSAVAALPGPRSMHVATLLADGRVLVAGGQSARGALVDTAAIYDPAANSWRDAGRIDTPKYKLALASLPDGGALVVGGQTADDPQARLARTERFDPRLPHGNRRRGRAVAPLLAIWTSAASRRGARPGPVSASAWRTHLAHAAEENDFGCHAAIPTDLPAVRAIIRAA